MLHMRYSTSLFGPYWRNFGLVVLFLQVYETSRKLTIYYNGSFCSADKF